MLLTPRIYQLSTAADLALVKNDTSHIHWAPSWRTDRQRRRDARRMLLVHQTGSVKVGELVRFTVTYDPAADRILPSPTHLYVRIKNTSALPLRAAYLHGPYALHVAVYPQDFDPFRKCKDTRKYGAPQFEPNVKAGAVWNARIPVPDELRLSGRASGASHDGTTVGKLTWIIEVTSQIIFSSSASVNFELLVSRDERSLDYGLAAVRNSGNGQHESGQVQDNQGNHTRHAKHRSNHKQGVYSKAIALIIDNTESLWNTPAFPKLEEEKEAGIAAVDQRRRSAPGQTEPKKTPPRKKRKIHLVILTHGLHSNLSADLLFMKETIDATAKESREHFQRRKAAEKLARDSTREQDEAKSSGHQSPENGLSEGDDDFDEEIMVRGFTGNAVKTENGIQYLGKRMAKWILDITYPDQPYKPIRRTMSQKLANTVAKKADFDSDTGQKSHPKSTIKMEDISDANLAYTFSKISFIGHSLGGLIQLYAIGYIQKHAPDFFDNIEPVNFVALATPFLGLSNENPMYVKFALDFGLVGRTGQDLGLTWRAPTLARNGWSAMGFGAAAKSQQPDPGAKPLLRILPTGPAHRVLRMFRNRTVYSNVVNDGIVPLRTSCLLFLDWRGLSRVEKARRENGIIGTVATWGWSELMGANSSPSRGAADPEEEIQGNSDDARNEDSFELTVPQPTGDETNEDIQAQQSRDPAAQRRGQDDGESGVSEEGKANEASPGALDNLRNFLGLTSKTTKKDLKMYKRSQTVDMSDEESLASQRQVGGESRQRGRPTASRGDSIMNDPNSNAPPKTSIFESAGDILHPPIPPYSWITDPASRARTIFHDRVYHPEDIPPPATKPQKTQRSFSKDSTVSMGAGVQVGSMESVGSDSSTMKVEEKIARAYHKDLSWRKVLVRLEPDAHNNITVRRMFANAYGWPVVKHLCDTHFGDNFAARTRDEREPATDRARGVEVPVDENGEHVKGQEDVTPPPRIPNEMREAADELTPLKSSVGSQSRPATSDFATRASSTDSYDDTYYADETDDEESQSIIPRFWGHSPLSGTTVANASKGRAPPIAKSQSPEPPTAGSDEHPGTTQAEIADFLTSEPATLEGHRGLAPTPSIVIDRPRSPTDVGLRKSIEEMTTPSSWRARDTVSENVAKSLGTPKKD